MLKITELPSSSTDHIAESTLYAMTLNGQACPVRACRVSGMPFNRLWPGHQRPASQTEEAGYVSFASDEPVNVEVTVKGKTGKMPKLLPLSAGIPVSGQGNKLSFTLPKPGQYVLSCGSMHHVLHLFFDPVKSCPEKCNATWYFGPGVHCPGLLNLKSGDSVYVDPDAVVFTSIIAKNAENIRIFGGGVIDGSAEERITRHCYTDHTKSIRFYFCKNIRIEDVVILNSPNWSISTYCCSGIVIDGIKIVGQWRYNTDGIDLCNSQHAKILNSFVRSFDDTIVLKGIDYRPFREFEFVRKNFGGLYGDWNGPVNVEDITVKNCVLWCDWGRTLEIGFETAAPEYRKILFEDCDLIHNSSAAMDIQHGDHAKIHDVTFRNIRVEYQAHADPEIYQASEDMVYDPEKRPPAFPVLICSRNDRFLENYSRFCGIPCAGLAEKMPWGIAGDIRYEKIRVFTEPGVPEKLPVCIGSLSGEAPYGPHIIKDLTVNGKEIRSLQDVEWQGTEPDAVIFE